MLTIDLPRGSQYAELTDLLCLHSARKRPFPFFEAVYVSTASFGISKRLGADEILEEPGCRVSIGILWNFLVSHTLFLRISHPETICVEGRLYSPEYATIRSCNQEMRTGGIHTHASDLLVRCPIPSLFTPRLP